MASIKGYTCTPFSVPPVSFAPTSAPYSLCMVVALAISLAYLHSWRDRQCAFDRGIAKPSCTAPEMIPDPKVILDTEMIPDPKVILVPEVIPDPEMIPDPEVIPEVIPSG